MGALRRARGARASRRHGVRRRRGRHLRQSGAVRPGEDFERYPARRGAGHGSPRPGASKPPGFVPPVEEMYPDGFGTWVEVGDLGDELENAVRPGHFRGVATVCLKLFNIVRPERAYFEQKDAQQATVLERMARDLTTSAWRSGSCRPSATPMGSPSAPATLSEPRGARGGHGLPRALAEGLKAGPTRRRKQRARPRRGTASRTGLHRGRTRLNGRVYLLAAARVQTCA